jgi:hypothetical protein
MSTTKLSVGIDLFHQTRPVE